MKKLLVVFALAISLGGCGPTLERFRGALEFGSAGISNPVTPERLKTVEDGAIVVFAGLNAYRRSCVELLIPQSCRRTIAAIQVYTRQIPAPLARLRTFVRNNDQVNAISTYNFVAGLIADAKAVATATNANLEAR